MQKGWHRTLLFLILLHVCKGQSYLTSKCTERPATATTSSTINSWSDLKNLLETSTADEVVLPSFQVDKLSSEQPIILTSTLAISCVEGGACILTSSENGVGSLVLVRGEHANVKIQGFTFKNASDGAIVVDKHVGMLEDGELMVCDSNFIGNKGYRGAAIRSHPKTKIHVESCKFSKNRSISGTQNSNEYGAGGGAVYNEGEMSIWFSTFDENSSQFGVIYTGYKSKLSLLQNTFILGDKQYGSSAVCLFANDSNNYIDEGGNISYDKYIDNDKASTYCNDIYVNNEDQCVAFIQLSAEEFKLQNMEVKDEMFEGAKSQAACTNSKGIFKNHAGDLKRCLWLMNDLRRSLNCNGLTELGRMCQKACEDCNIPLRSDKEEIGPIQKNRIRRKRKREKIIKKRQREREQKPMQSSGQGTNETSSSSKIPTNNPKYQNNKHEETDIVFYVIGDAPYKVNELDPTTGFPQQVRGIPNDAEFVVHVGDILSAKESECHISWYQQVSYILRSSSDAPVFITPGDNDWLDCEPYIGAKVALDQWQNTFDRFHSSWSPHKFDVQHQPTIRENMAFVHKRVLFLILHLVSDYYDIESERKIRHSRQLAWANNQIEAHKADIDAIVIIGHSPPSLLNRDFFSARYDGISNTIKTLDVPVVYIHGSGHKFAEEENFNSLDNFLRIQVPGRQANPVRVSFDKSKTFYFDFNDDEIVTDCCADGWPRRKWSSE